MAHVLFVDADPFFVRLYVDLLTSAGHRTSSVNKLPEFTQLKDEAFDVAFVELGFQFEQGLKIVEQLKARAKPPEIIGVMKSGEQALLATALKLGVTDVLTKPVEGTHLLALVNRVLERQKLHLEATRLQSEHAAQQSLQKLFADGLSLLKTLDDTALHERLLKTASVQTDCQGIALYVAKRTHLELVGYYGLIEGDKLPPSLALSVFDLQRRDLVPNVYAVDNPMAIQKSEPPARVEPHEGKGLVFVLAQDGQPEGIVVANARLGHPFQASDLTRLQMLADVASVAFMNSRRYSAERKKAVQTRNANTYNMSFFVDFLGKELHKSRRYRRSFSIIQMVFDNYPGLAAELGPRATERLANDIPRVLQDVLRESDVLARAADNEYLIVLPESDIYGARMTMGRIEAALVRDPSLVAMQKNLTLGTAIAYSSFPQDGNDIDSLMAATRRRLDEMRRSAYRKLHFEDSSFYEAAQILLSKSSPMRRFIDSPIDYAYTQMTPNEVSAWVRELLHSTQALQKSHSVLYWGVPEISIEILAAIADVLEIPPAGSPNRLFVLGAKDSSIKDVPPGITTVYLDPEKATQMGFLFSLSETHAYAMIGENLSVAPGEAFHTCDTHLALGLVRKLQAEFNLQRWF